MYVFYTRNRNSGIGNIFRILVLGPLGLGSVQESVIWAPIWYMVFNSYVLGLRVRVHATWRYGVLVPGFINLVSTSRK